MYSLEIAIQGFSGFKPKKSSFSIMMDASTEAAAITESQRTAIFLDTWSDGKIKSIGLFEVFTLSAPVSGIKAAPEPGTEGERIARMRMRSDGLNPNKTHPLVLKAINKTMFDDNDGNLTASALTAIEAAFIQTGTSYFAGTNYNRFTEVVSAYSDRLPVITRPKEV